MKTLRFFNGASKKIASLVAVTTCLTVAACGGTSKDSSPAVENGNVAHSGSDSRDDVGVTVDGGSEVCQCTGLDQKRYDVDATESQDDAPCASCGESQEFTGSYTRSRICQNTSKGCEWSAWDPAETPALGQGCTLRDGYCVPGSTSTAGCSAGQQRNCNPSTCTMGACQCGQNQNVCGGSCCATQDGSNTCIDNTCCHFSKVCDLGNGDWICCPTGNVGDPCNGCKGCSVYNGNSGACTAAPGCSYYACDGVCRPTGTCGVCGVPC